MVFSGKTTLVHRILKEWERLVRDSPPIWQFILVYEHEQPIYDDMIRVLKEKFPNCVIKCFWGWDEKEMSNPTLFRSTAEGQTLLVVDDSHHKVNKSEAFLKICRGKAHHERITVFIIFQDLSSAGGGHEFRSALKNIHYFLVTQGSSELLQHIQRKLYTYMRSFIQSAFEAARECCAGGGRSYPYILINATVSCPKEWSVTTGVFQGEEPFLLAPVV